RGFKKRRRKRRSTKTSPPPLRKSRPSPPPTTLPRPGKGGRRSRSPRRTCRPSSKTSSSCASAYLAYCSRMGKCILVTGGAGFVGTALCRRLVADGHQVIVLDNYFTGSRDNHVPGVEYREGHTKDVAKLVSETPDLTYHLGEYSRAEQSIPEPALVFDLNTL